MFRKNIILFLIGGSSYAVIGVVRAGYGRIVGGGDC
jgi:hypothetical protein